MTEIVLSSRDALLSHLSDKHHLLLNGEQAREVEVRSPQASGVFPCRFHLAD